MYFTNITNPELNYFHGIKPPSFSIKLTTALTSDLFKIETIISDTLYKLYPLFYCETITSSNPNDKVLDNKCIICKKETNDTLLTFITDDTGVVEDYVNFMADGTGLFSVGNSLTTAQFNSIVQLLRNNHGISKPISFSQSTIQGDYGEYDFSIKTGFIDIGILINSSHLSTATDFHVKLSNAVFKSSSYTLNMRAMRISNVNITGEDSTDNITYIDVDVPLTNGEFVQIPTTDLAVGDILLYDCNVTITHDQPVITGSWINTLNVTADKDVFQTGDTCNITATALDIGDIGLANAPVSFKFYDSNDTLIDTKTGTTDTNGQCTVSYLGNHTGQLYIRADCMNLQKTYEILDCIFYDKATTGHKNSNWTIPSSITETVSDEGTTLSATLSASTAKRAYCGSLTGDFEILFTLKTTGRQIRFGVRDIDNAITYKSKTYEDWTEIKIRVKDNTIRVFEFVNDEWNVLTLNSENADLTKTLSFLIYIYNTAENASCTFKDLKIYPI